LKESLITKLVALKLKKYASLWRTNVHAKRANKRKGKIITKDSKCGFGRDFGFGSGTAKSL